MRPQRSSVVTPRSAETEALDRLTRAETASDTPSIADIALEVLSEGVVVHGPDGAIVSANPAAQKIFGLSLDEFRGAILPSPKWRLVHEDMSTWGIDDNPAKITLRTRIPQTGVVMGVHRPDGSFLWISVSTRSAVLPDGRVGVVVAFVDITSLRDAESEHRMLFESTGVPTAIIDAQHSTVLRVNGAFCRWLGRTSASLVGADYGELMSHEDRWRATVSGHAIGETVVDADGRVELCFRHADGTIRWALSTMRRLPSRASDPPAVIVQAVDITELKRVTAALQHTEERFRSTIATMRDPMMILTAVRDGGGVIVDFLCEQANPAAAQFGGARPMVGATQRTMFSLPVHLPAFETAKAVVETGESAMIAIPRMSGDEVVGSWEASLAKFGDGYVVVLRDVSARERDSRLLREREQQFRMIADSAAVVQARSGIAEWVAPSVESVLGWTWDEIVGNDLRELVHPLDAARIDGTEFDTDIGGEARFRLRARHKDGSYRWVDVGARGIHDEQGVLTGSSVYTFWDVQAEVEAIEALKRVQEHEREMEARTDQSARLASLGVLAGGVAHDFNNILAAILGNVSFAKEEVGDGHVALESLEQIRTAGLRGKSLVDQILAFSRNRPPALVVQPIRPPIDEALALVRASMPSSAQIDTAFTDETILVSADATKIGQVLLNLCTNAWHAAGDRNAHITIGLERIVVNDSEAETNGLDPGSYAHVWVVDRGDGIEEAVLDQIFDPFFTTKSVGLGTGLGLSVVHGIVRDHGGTVSVDSEPGTGSTFHLYFPSINVPVVPVVPVVGPDESSATTADYGAVKTDSPNERARVLYVDDDELVLGLVRRVIQRAGMNVTCLSDPSLALEAVRAAPFAFDVVVTDFNMPSLSGLDLATAVIDIRADLPVVISSGFVTADMIATAETVGVRHVLRKENTMLELVGVVERVLTGA